MPPNGHQGTDKQGNEWMNEWMRGKTNEWLHEQVTLWIYEVLCSIIISNSHFSGPMLTNSVSAKVVQVHVKRIQYKVEIHSHESAGTGPPAVSICVYYSRDVIINILWNSQTPWGAGGLYSVGTAVTLCTCSVTWTDRTVSIDPHVGLSNYIYCTLIPPQTFSIPTNIYVQYIPVQHIHTHTNFSHCVNRMYIHLAKCTKNNQIERIQMHFNMHTYRPKTASDMHTVTQTQTQCSL